MSEQPKVSVVLTCYDLGRYLDEAVDSVLAQTFQDFEILVVDDGSTEPATVQLLADYQRPRTRVIHIANRGLSGARNEGIRQTTGPYVCTLDADDRLEATYFEKAVAVLDHDPSVAFVSHWLKTFGDEEREWKPESADFPALLDMNTINGAALVRRTALMTVGLFDESMRHGCEDWDLWISMVERGLRGVILPEILFFYRRRHDSMSRMMMQGETHVGLYRYLIEKHRASFEAHFAELVVRREIDKTTMLAESHDLELDCQTVLRPAVERLRDEHRVSSRKLERLLRQSDTNAELSRRGHLITEMDAELSRRAQTMVEMNTELARCARAMTEMDTELAGRAQLMTGMDAELARRAQAMTEMDTELSRRAQTMAEMNAELTRCAQAMTEMDTELSRRAQTMTEMNAELAGRAQVITGMDTELARRAQTIAEKDHELLRQTQAMADQAAELDQGARTISDRDARVELLSRRAAEQQDELLHAREGIAGLQHEIQMLRGSLSWRLARPLRTVYSWLFERG